ncbi:MAG: glycosyltransferase family 4 protein, partial [Acidimicrobiales bacterium]
AVACTRHYPVPAVADLVAPRIGRVGAFVVGAEIMRRVQHQMAADINAGGYQVAFLHASRFSRSVPIAEWLKVPSVYDAQEPRRVGYEAQVSPPWRDGKGLMALAPLLRRPYEALGKRRDRRAVACVGRILCNSLFSADIISAVYGVEPVVCYLGVGTGAFSPQVDHLAAGVDSEVLRVMSVGALHPVKGHDLALEAAALAGAVLDHPVEVDVVYERERPGYKAEVESLASGLGVALRLHRGITDQELAGLYRSATVTVCAARLEPFGLITLESMSCGTPVVAVSQGGFRETVVDGVNGYLTERNRSPLAEGVVRVARGEIGATPQSLHSSVAEHWSWDRSAARVADQLRAAAAAAS